MELHEVQLNVGNSVESIAAEFCGEFNKLFEILDIKLLKKASLNG